MSFENFKHGVASSHLLASPPGFLLALEVLTDEGKISADSQESAVAINVLFFSHLWFAGVWASVACVVAKYGFEQDAKTSLKMGGIVFGAVLGACIAFFAVDLAIRNACGRKDSGIKEAAFDLSFVEGIVNAPLTLVGYAQIKDYNKITDERIW